MPLPVPLAPLTTVSQSALFDAAVHEQLAPVVTEIVAPSPCGAAFALVGAIEKVHAAAS
jgi:hypothetical protein